MDVQQLQKLWNQSRITFVFAGHDDVELKSVVENLDDGIWLSHYNADELVDLEKLGDTQEQAEAVLRKLIADYS